MGVSFTIGGLAVTPVPGEPLIATRGKAPESPRREIRTVALIGPPNSGKSTLFNRLTGLRQKVGNYPGVTVEHIPERQFVPMR